MVPTLFHLQEAWDYSLWEFVVQGNDVLFKIELY